MWRQERDILERAVHAVSEQAVKADELVDEATAAGGGSAKNCDGRGGHHEEHAGFAGWLNALGEARGGV